MITNTMTAVATESRIVHAKSPQPGPPNGGNGNGLNDQAAVLRPENDPSPMKTSEPTPAASSPGRSTSGRIGAAEPRRLDQQHGADHRRTEDRRHRSEAPRRGHQAHGLVGRVPLDQPHRERAEPDAHRDQGPSGPEHEPEPERRQRRQQHARQLDRSGRRATGLEPVDGHMTAVSGQAHHGKRGQQAREGHPWKRPPDRHGVVAEVLRQILVDPHLDLVNPFQEAPRGGRDHQPDQHREDEQDAVLPAQQQRSRIVGHKGNVHPRRRLGRSRVSAAPCLGRGSRAKRGGRLATPPGNVAPTWWRSPMAMVAASTRAYGAFKATDSPILGDVPPPAVVEDGLASHRYARASS